MPGSPIIARWITLKSLNLHSHLPFDNARSFIYSANGLKADGGSKVHITRQRHISMYLSHKVFHKVYVSLDALA